MYTLIGGSLVFFLAIFGDAWGCNPRNVMVETCGDAQKMTFVVKEMVRVDTVGGSQHALTAYQKKVFESKKRIYLVKTVRTFKLGRLYYDGFYIACDTTFFGVPSLDDERIIRMFTGETIQLNFDRVCLKNIFYSTGIDTYREGGNRYIYLNYRPVLNLKSIAIQ